METSEATNVYNQMPGSLIYTGEQHVDAMRLECIRFNHEHFEETNISIDDLTSVIKKDHITWLNIVGLHETEKMRAIGDHFQIHNLILEDILNVNQRSTFDEYEDHYFIACKMIRTISESVISEQFSILIGNDYIITFQEKEGDVFDGVRSRIRNTRGKIRNRGTDYLSFALLDVIVDHYMEIVEEYGDEINDQEIKLLDHFDKDMIKDINLSKKEINYLRKHARPLRDTIIAFNKSDNGLIDKKTRPFLRDLLDHISNITEGIEVYRETINDNFNTYNTQISNKLNDVLKVLTIFSVIFIPLTFLAGIYGMNFENMPELSKPYAYPLLLIVMVLISASMIIYFKRKKWL